MQKITRTCMNLLVVRCEDPSPFVRGTLEPFFARYLVMRRGTSLAACNFPHHARRPLFCTVCRGRPRPCSSRVSPTWMTYHIDRYTAVRRTMKLFDNACRNSKIATETMVGKSGGDDIKPSRRREGDHVADVYCGSPLLRCNSTAVL